MTYLKIDNEYADGCFNHLQVFLRILDSELSAIDLKIKKSKDTVSDGLCDLVEYLTGYGFVAIQRYIASTYPQTGQNKGNIYKQGLELCDDLFLIEAINAGANYWKHHDEWFSTEKKTNKQIKSLDSQICRTLAVIEKLTPYADYNLSNLLAEIINKVSLGSPLSFKSVLPFIEQWRNELDNSER